jgi:hypothetical protein
MKYLVFSVLGIGLMMACTGKESNKVESFKNDTIAAVKFLKFIENPDNCTTVVWLDSIYKELGDVKEGQLLELSWRLKNTGDRPLIVSRVTTSCGCTVADKPKEPITSNEEGKIDVTFNTEGRLGLQQKDIYVLANSKPNIIQTLSFAVNVVK